MIAAFMWWVFITNFRRNARQILMGGNFYPIILSACAVPAA
jgi:hypothetical protein